MVDTSFTAGDDRCSKIREARCSGFEGSVAEGEVMIMIMW